MNEGALNALTTNDPNGRDKFILFCAQRLMHRFPHIRKADNHRIMWLLTVCARWGFTIDGYPVAYALRATTELANDIASVWQYQIDERA